MSRSRARRAVLALLALTPLLAACNAILGISDYEKTDCAGGVCDGGSSSSGGPDAGDAQTDAPINVIDAQGTEPVSWAQKPMPNYRTGDEDSGPNDFLETLTVGKDGAIDVVVDQITKLTWRKADAKESDLSWEEAKTTCPPNYRLPTRIELVTLLNFKANNPNVRANQVLGLSPTRYWTTSLERTRDSTSSALTITSNHWVIVFDDSEKNRPPVARIGESDTKAGVICVRGGS